MKPINYLALGLLICISSLIWLPFLERYPFYFLLHLLIGLGFMIKAIDKNL